MRAMSVGQMLAEQRLLKPQDFVIPQPDWTRVPSYARIGDQDLKLEGKGKPLTLSPLEIKQLTVFLRDNDPSLRALHEEFLADGKAQAAGTNFAEWQPPRELSNVELAMRGGIDLAVRAHNRLSKNGLLFRTKAVDDALVTSNSGIAVRFVLADRTQFAFGIAERFLAVRPYEHPLAPTYVMVRGAWFKPFATHANGLRVVKKMPTHDLNRTPFTFASSLYPANVQYWPAARAGEFFVVIVDATGGDI